MSSVCRYVPKILAKQIRVSRRLVFKRETKKFSRRGLYLIQFEDGVKVGISDNVLKRLESYNKPWGKRILDAIMYSCSQPRRLELKIMRHYKSKIKENSLEFISNIRIEQVMKFIEQDSCYKKKY